MIPINYALSIISSTQKNFKTAADWHASPASSLTCKSTEGWTKLSQQLLPTAHCVYLGRQALWVQHTLAQNAPSLHHKPSCPQNGLQSPLESGGTSHFFLQRLRA